MRTKLSLYLAVLLLVSHSVFALLPYGVSNSVRKNNSDRKAERSSKEKKKTEKVFKFEPDTLTAGVPTDVKIVLDLGKLPKDVAKTVDKYMVYQVNAFSGERLALKFDLKDNGKAPNGDKKRQDSAFSTILPFRSDNNFESLSFEAVPVISGVEDPNSALVTRAAKAITVFPPSPSMEIPSTEHVTSVPSLKGLELVVNYIWKNTGNTELNLNSATEFLGEIGGFRCRNHNDLVHFQGENKDLVNKEISIVHIGRALDEGKWKQTAFVKLKAGWRGTGSQEPAEVVIVLRDSATQQELPETTLSMPISPGTQNVCAKDVIGVVQVLVGDVTHISLLPM